MRMLIILALLLPTFTFAQPFGVAPPDTVFAFDSNLESEAYRTALELPTFNGVNVGISADSPLTVKMWSSRQGWDVVVFDLESRQTSVYHLEFSGVLTQIENKTSVLVPLAKKKCP